MSEEAASRIAAAIGEPSRARMLYALIDGHARTSTELALVAGISPSTASVHLHRLESEHLIKPFAQGKHRYYSLASRSTARVLESLLVLAGTPCDSFRPTTPAPLRAARSCYDHMAGATAVALHDSLLAQRWLRRVSSEKSAYNLTSIGEQALLALGIDGRALQLQRRRFAYPCLDWSERKPHLAGSLAASLLDLAIHRKWLRRELNSRALVVTRIGTQEFLARFGLTISA
jgi:DNA-binding transcriptional ArsR family regulator